MLEPTASMELVTVQKSALQGVEPVLDLVREVTEFVALVSIHII